MANQRPGAFRTRSGEANLVVCLVAFMDLLGVKAMTKLPHREELARLRSLDATMRDVLAIGKPTSFRTSTFSDSIAIALPLPRRATDQATALRQLWNKKFDLDTNPLSKVQIKLESNLESGHCYVAALSNGGEIGFLALHEEGGVYQVDSIYVSHEFHRQGVATAMVERAKEVTGKNSASIALLTEDGKAFASSLNGVDLEMP